MKSNPVTNSRPQKNLTLAGRVIEILMGKVSDGYRL